MLKYFPTLYDDELLYSVFSRYHYWSGNSHLSHTMEDIFEDKNASMVYDLPKRLMVLASQLPSGMGVDINSLIDNHTMLPLYRPFLAEERYLRAKDKMMSTNRGGVPIIVGRGSTLVAVLEKLRYCPICVQEDKKDVGEPYWHRSHQVVGVRFCHLHGAWLIESTVTASSRNFRYKLIPLVKEVQGVRFQQTSSPQTFEHELTIAETVSELLTGNFHSLSEILAHKYMEELKKVGLVTYSGSIRFSQLTKLFQEYYGYEYLKTINCHINLEKKRNWISSMLKSRHLPAHPILHILMMKFLDVDIKKFLLHEHNINNNNKFQPFGSSPWPCQNLAANHYRKDVVDKCVINSKPDGKLVRGTFYCECGFIYSRIGPDNDEYDRYKRSRIIKTGLLLDEKILSLSNEGYSSRVISEKLMISKRAILKRLQVLKCTSNKNEIEDNKKVLFEIKKNKYREHFLQIIKNNKKIKRGKISDFKGSGYSWLFRNDHDWLIKILSTLEKNSLWGKLKVDWKKRDSEYVIQIKNELKKLRTQIGKPVHIKKWTILKTLYKYSQILPNIEKMPKTSVQLKKSIECLDDFRIRKLLWASEEIIAKGEKLNKTNLMKFAGLARGREYSHKIHQAINALLNGLPIVLAE